MASTTGQHFGEVRLPRGNGDVPDVVKSDGTAVEDYTITATEVGAVSWTRTRQKSIVINNSGVTVYMVIGGEDCSDTHGEAIPIAHGQTYVIGGNRPHEHNKLAFYASVDLVLSGTGKNLTVIGWARDKA